MWVDRATPEFIRRVAEQMRDSDVRELLALSWLDGPESLTAALVERYGPVGLAVGNGAGPIAVGAVIEHRPHVLTLGLFATSAFVTIARPLARFVKRGLLAPAITGGAHRIEAVSWAEHRAAHRWIEALGLRQEAVYRKFGKNGEDFIQFAWVKKDVCASCFGDGSARRH